MKNVADYVTNHQPPIHHSQMQPCYIHTSHLVRKIMYIIKLCEGLLNRFLCTQSSIIFLNTIQTEPQSMTKKYHTFKRLNFSIQYIMQLRNLSRYLYETHYNTDNPINWTLPLIESSPMILLRHPSPVRYLVMNSTTVPVGISTHTVGCTLR